MKYTLNEERRVITDALNLLFNNLDAVVFGKRQLEEVRKVVDVVIAKQVDDIYVLRRCDNDGENK